MPLWSLLVISTGVENTPCGDAGGWTALPVLETGERLGRARVKSLTFFLLGSVRIARDVSTSVDTTKTTRVWQNPGNVSVSPTRRGDCSPECQRQRRFSFATQRCLARFRVRTFSARICDWTDSQPSTNAFCADPLPKHNGKVLFEFVCPNQANGSAV